MRRPLKQWLAGSLFEALGRHWLGWPTALLALTVTAAIGVAVGPAAASRRKRP
jgi:hypothetical protein